MNHTCRKGLNFIRRHPVVLAALICGLPLILSAVAIIGYQDIQVVTTPGNPASGFVRFFANSSGLGCLTSSGGNCLTAAPSGSAGGDLSGSYPNPTVAKVNGGSVPASQTCLGSNSSSQLVTGTCSGGSGALTQIAQTVISGSSTNTVTFSSLGSYTSLMVTILARSSNASNTDNIYLQINGDTMADYTSGGSFSTPGGSISGFFNSAAAKQQFMNIAAASQTSGLSSYGTFTIPNYGAATFAKAAYGSESSPSSNSVTNQNFAYQWTSNAAITSIVFGLTSAGNFVAGSTFTLYGIQ